VHVAALALAIRALISIADFPKFITGILENNLNEVLKRIVNQ
jgi:hypothetical protein